MPDQDRAPKALPSFQRYRIYQTLRNLQWIDLDGYNHPVSQIEGFVEQLAKQLNSKSSLSFNAIRTALKKTGVIDYDAELNLEAMSNEKIEGNLTSAAIRNAEKNSTPIWDTLSEEDQDSLIMLLLNDDYEDIEVAQILKGRFRHKDEVIEKLMHAKLPAGHSHLSAQAITSMLPLMHSGMTEYQARVAAGFSKDLFDLPVSTKIGTKTRHAFSEPDS